MRNCGDNQDVDDSELMIRLCAQDQSALAEIYCRNAKILYAALFRITANAGVSEELLQDLFVKVWIKADQFDDAKASLRVWLLTAARNLAFDYLRSSRVRFNLSCLRLDDLHSIAGKDPTWTLLRAHQAAAGLSTLPSREKDILELAYFDGYSQVEIAALLGEPLGTVKSRAKSGLARLNNLWGAQGCV